MKSKHATGLLGFILSYGACSPEQHAPRTPQVTLEDYLSLPAHANHKLIFFCYNGRSMPQNAQQTSIPQDCRDIVEHLTRDGGSYTIKGIRTEDPFMAAALLDKHTAESIKEGGSLDIIYFGRFSEEDTHALGDILEKNLGFRPRSYSVW